MPQSRFDRFYIGRFQSSFLPALLVVALGVTGTVTFHAYKASKEHRAVVERVMSAYVSFVAERVKEASQMAMFSCAEVWLRPVMTSERRGIDKLAINGYCGEKDGGRFDLDLVGRTTHAANGIPPELVSWLLDTIPSNPTIEYAPRALIGTLTRDVRGKSELISYTVLFEGGRKARAIGFIAAGALPRIMNHAQSLVKVPTQMAAAGNLPDYFEVQHSPNVRVRAAAEELTFRTSRALDPEFGGIQVFVALRQAGLNRLAPGGLPRDRGFEFLGLFALAAGLVISSLLLLRREAELARTRANFVSGISHELRTPLAQIRMFAEMLLLGRARNDADRRRSLQIIDTEARRLSHLVENVLQVARSENGHLHVNPAVMPVAPLVRECVESFNLLAQARSIEFRMELQESLVAPVDSAALRQIVLNLLDNAAKYGPGGQRVVVGVALFDNTARLWVDDEGPGIPVRERARVFETFYRTRDVHNTTGSGIGLAVVRELVVLHGGNAWVEAAPDAGARVVVEFPGAYLAAAEQPAGDIAVA